MALVFWKPTGFASRSTRRMVLLLRPVCRAMALIERQFFMIVRGAVLHERWHQRSWH